MPVTTLLRCAAALMLAAPLCLYAEPFDAKPGAWEMTTTTVTTGAFFPPEAMAKMAPEQRALLEKHMRERSGRPVTRVAKTCMTAARLEQEAMLAFQGSAECTQKILTKSAKKISTERTCTKPRAYTATWTAEAPTPEAMTAISEVVLPNGGKMRMEIKGKWLGATCEGIKKH